MPMLATSVELTFDPSLAEKIQNVWNALTSGDIKCQHHPLGSLPHISLAIRHISEDNQRSSFDVLCHRLNRFPVRFDATGMFLSPRGINYPDDTVVLFLAPKPTEALLEANRIASEVLQGWNENGWEHYRPERWVPHCTLAEHLVKRDIATALGICSDKLGGPIAGSICGIRLINFGAGELEEWISRPLAEASS